jgi:hypothetical protein
VTSNVAEHKDDEVIGSQIKLIGMWEWTFGNDWE